MFLIPFSNNIFLSRNFSEFLPLQIRQQFEEKLTSSTRKKTGNIPKFTFSKKFSLKRNFQIDLKFPQFLLGKRIHGKHGKKREIPIR